MTVVRLGFRQIFRQPNWKYMKKFLIASLNLGIANLGIDNLVKSLFTGHCEERSDKAIS
jgi:hypothetical protein